MLEKPTNHRRNVQRIAFYCMRSRRTYCCGALFEKQMRDPAAAPGVEVSHMCRPSIFFVQLALSSRPRTALRACCLSRRNIAPCPTVHAAWLSIFSLPIIRSRCVLPVAVTNVGTFAYVSAWTWCGVSNAHLPVLFVSPYSSLCTHEYQLIPTHRPEENNHGMHEMTAPMLGKCIVRFRFPIEETFGYV